MRLGQWGRGQPTSTQAGARIRARPPRGRRFSRLPLLPPRAPPLSTCRVTEGSRRARARGSEGGAGLPSTSSSSAVEWQGKEGGDPTRSLSHWSVVIPTYNRLPILTKCLDALERQRLDSSTSASACAVRSFEVVVVDDGSTDETVAAVRSRVASGAWARVRLVAGGTNRGAAAARNIGVAQARGGVVVFIDSDLVVAEDFLAEHARALGEAMAGPGQGQGHFFTYGAVINTSNFDAPWTEKMKVSDHSAAFFATGNVAIPYATLMEASETASANAHAADADSREEEEGGRSRSNSDDDNGDEAERAAATAAMAGPFDASFSTYGWEDLELGERLRAVAGGCRLVRAPGAKGFHWHPAFRLEDLPARVEQEVQRGANGIKFWRKHPNFRVRLMIQYTPFHYFLWWLLTLGGLLSARRMQRLGLLRWMEARLGLKAKRWWPRLLGALLVPALNWECVRATFRAAKEAKAAKAAPS